MIPHLTGAGKPTCRADANLIRQSLADIYLGRTDADGAATMWFGRGPRPPFLSPTAIDQMANLALAHSDAGRDVYAGANLIDWDRVPEIRRHKGRGKEAEILSVCEIFVDVDCGDKPGHAYPDQATALAAIQSLPIPPTLIYQTGPAGGGLHVRYLYREPVHVESDEHRDRLKYIARAWQDILRDRLNGFELDKTYDLSRPSRVAGTVNKKHGCLVVPIYRDMTNRYTPDDFVVHVPPQPKPAPSIPSTPRSTASKKGYATEIHVTLDMIPYADRVERAERYAQRYPGAIAGQKGHDHTFRLCCVLAKDFALEDFDAWSILSRWNQTCSPPWSDYDLRHKLTDAENAPGPVGAKVIVQAKEKIEIEKEERWLAKFLDTIRFPISPPGKKENEQRGSFFGGFFRDTVKTVVYTVASTPTNGVKVEHDTDVGPTLRYKEYIYRTAGPTCGPCSTFTSEEGVDEKTTFSVEPTTYHQISDPEQSEREKNFHVADWGRAEKCPSPYPFLGLRHAGPAMIHAGCRRPGCPQCARRHKESEYRHYAARMWQHPGTLWIWSTSREHLPAAIKRARRTATKAGERLEYVAILEEPDPGKPDAREYGVISSHPPDDCGVRPATSQEAECWLVDWLATMTTESSRQTSTNAVRASKEWGKREKKDTKSFSYLGQCHDRQAFLGTLSRWGVERESRHAEYWRRPGLDLLVAEGLFGTVGAEDTKAAEDFAEEVRVREAESDVAADAWGEMLDARRDTQDTEVEDF